MANQNISTKHNSQCLTKAEDNEPIFVLRANDPTASMLVRAWANRNKRIQPADKINSALQMAKAMDEWYDAKHATAETPTT